MVSQGYNELNNLLEKIDLGYSNNHDLWLAWFWPCLRSTGHWSVVVVGNRLPPLEPQMWRWQPVPRASMMPWNISFKKNKRKNQWFWHELRMEIFFEINISLTHWGLAMPSCSSVIIGSGSGLLLVYLKATMCTNTDLSSIRWSWMYWNQIVEIKFYLKSKIFQCTKCVWKFFLQNGSHFVNVEAKIFIFDSSPFQYFHI